MHDNANNKCSRPTALHPCSHTSARLEATAGCSGFTLIEIMVVVVILGIMAALIVPKVIGQPDVTRYSLAKGEIKKLASMLEMYQLQQRAFPTTDQGLEALVTSPGNTAGLYPQRGYMDKDALNDPWGNRWVYRSPGDHGPFDLTSYGRDGLPGGEGVDADIHSW